MNLLLLAAESLGVRSMATAIDTTAGKICIDPAAALGPSRFGLPPHKREERALKNSLATICQATRDAQFIVITHYHYDHFLPETDIYSKKIIFAKSIKKNINKNQKQRGTDFAERWKQVSTIVYSDDSIHNLGDTTIHFSPPFPHGPRGTRLGFTTMVTVEDKQTIIYTSDVQGPIDSDAVTYIINQHPDFIIADGPPTYLAGWRFSHDNIRCAERNLMAIMEQTDSCLILDHHLLRDENYIRWLPNLYREYGERIQTYAEYNGTQNQLLESQRKRLWKEEP